MNPAFTNWWLSQHGGPNAYQDSIIGAPEQDFMQQYNVMPREDVERMGKVIVPGTGGMQEAPQMPAPKSWNQYERERMERTKNTPNGFQNAMSWMKNFDVERSRNSRSLYDEAAALEEKIASGRGSYADEESLKHIHQLIAQTEANPQPQEQDVSSQDIINPEQMPAYLQSLQDQQDDGKIHGITPDPRTAPGQPNAYDTVEGPHNGPLDMQGNPVNQGAPSAGPLEKGSAAATQAVGERKRGRYEMDEIQQRRALGAAIMQLFAQRPGASEHETGLTRMAYNMSPATQAYLSEAHHMENLNERDVKEEAAAAERAFDHKLKIAEYERKVKKDEARGKFNSLTLAEQQRIITSAQSDEIKIMKEERQALKDWATNNPGKARKPDEVAKQEALIAKKWAPLRNRLKKRLEDNGLSLEEISAAPEAAAPAETGAIPESRLNQIKELLKAGKADAANGVSPEELTAFLSQIARK